MAGLLFHQNLPLFLESEAVPYDLYKQILDYIRWSDRADFWAFFHQCWNLLPLSYHLKLKYPNQLLQAFPKPATIPDLQGLVYTQVLTKQSALFNSWKEMNRISNEEGTPFRCVTQWATYQTGKLKETLGLPLLLPSSSQTPPATEPASAAPPAPADGPSGSSSAPARKTTVRRKKSDATPLKA